MKAPRRGRSLSLEVRGGLLEEVTCILEEHQGVCQADKAGKGVPGRGNNMCEDPEWEHSSSSGRDRGFGE